MKRKFLLWILKTFYSEYSVAHNLLITDNVEIYLKNKNILGDNVMLKGNSIIMETVLFGKKQFELEQKYGRF